MLPLRGLVAFPGADLSFDVVRESSQDAIKAAQEQDHTIFISAQQDPDVEKPVLADIYEIGTIAKIKQTVRLPGGMMRVVVEGEVRGAVVRGQASARHMSASVEVLEDEKDEELSEMLLDEAFLRTLEETFKKYLANGMKVNKRLIMESLKRGGLGAVADVMAANIDLKYSDKQELLETLDVYDRMERLIELLNQEAQILEIMKHISEKVKKQMDQNQKEYYLREELHAIQEELGVDDGFDEELSEYRRKISELKLSPESEKKLLKDVDRMEHTPPNSPDAAVTRNYLDQILSLPWNERTEETRDLQYAEEILNRDHYGLEKVKERILEHLAVHCMTDGKTNNIICLAGPPGTGKTSIARSIAESLNRKYVRISLGGVHDEADIRGHRKTYIGAMPGRIMDAMRQAESKNPLILLDEIDKMGADFKGDPSAALLEVLDREQNHAFRDHYMEIPFDLSEVMFLMTANSLSEIPAPLLDRIELIEVSGYTEEEKLEIAKRYLLPKQLKRQGLTKSKANVTDDALLELIQHYTRESGVRQLEREIEGLLRKAAKAILCGEKKSIRISRKNLFNYIGKQKFRYDLKNDQDEVGVVRGLAWTQVGGDTLSVEVSVMPGTGKVELTGKLGDVMKESAMTAVSYIRSRSEELHIGKNFYKENDLHIHVPEGAVPKDGPSAGITIATAVASALTNRPVRCDVAMTGEITLRGRVLPIGGLKEKSLAAYRAGIRTIIIPNENEADLEEIPESIRNEIQFIPVRDADHVLKKALK